jgi:type I restriction enzyme, S subunit
MKTVIRPETEMKDSGIEYVGAIPNDWDLVRLRAYFGERKNKNKDGNETNLLSLSYGRIIRKNIDKTDGLLPASFNTYNIVEKNDIIIRPTDLQNDKRSLRTGLVTEHGIITSAYIDLMPIGNVDSRFVHYLLHSYDILKVFYNMGSGVRQGLNYSEFSKLKVPMPLLSEQQAIADYLDETCSKIDEIIAEAKASIDEYKELKQSVIFEAVTKGLDKNIEMKDSGVEWIGEIPNDAKLVPLKYLVSKTITDGTHQTPDYESSENGSPFLSSKDISSGKIDFSNIKYITKKLHEELYKNVAPQINDILLAKNGTTGVAALVETDMVFDIYVTLALIRPDITKVLPKYLLHDINCYVVKRQFDEHLLGIGVPNLHLSVIRNTKVIIHNKNQQKEISDFLDKRTAEIDSLITEKESLINDLEAYKKSLIYEVVTGKRRVV